MFAAQSPPTSRVARCSVDADSVLQVVQRQNDFFVVEAFDLSQSYSGCEEVSYAR
jgi:hypothetical protein